MAAIALIGYGELGSVLGGALARVHDVRPWSRSRPGTLEDAVDGAALVISAVPGAAAEEVAERMLPLLGPDACFADLSAASPEAKERAAARYDFYADGAVLGTTPMTARFFRKRRARTLHALVKLLRMGSVPRRRPRLNEMTMPTSPTVSET